MAARKDREEVYRHLSEAATYSGYDRRNLMKAAFMESTFGKNIGEETDTHYGLMQSEYLYTSPKRDKLEYPDIDREDAAFYYGKEVLDRTKANEGDSGDLWGQGRIIEKAKNIGIRDKGFLEYLSWQQGRRGLAEIIHVLDDPDSGLYLGESIKGLSGTFSSTTRENLTSNMSNADRDYFKGMSDYDLAVRWLNENEQKWEDYGREIMLLDNEYGDSTWELPE